MPTTTQRLSIPVPTSGDPANNPADLLSLANALDSGATPSYNGAVVMIDTPGGVGSLPSSPIVGTIYPVNSSPPYLLYYTGEAVTGTPTAPTGWRLIGQAGTNTANMSNTSPGNSVSVGVQPVWAPLDHRHASLPWSNNQTTAAYTGATPSDGSAAAYARADHSHATALVPMASDYLPTTVSITSSSYAPLPSGGCAVELTTGSLVLVTVISQVIASTASNAAVEFGFSVSGASSIPAGNNGMSWFYTADGFSGITQTDITASLTYPVTVTPGSNTFTVEAEVLESGGLNMSNTYIIVQNMGA